MRLEVVVPSQASGVFMVKRVMQESEIEGENVVSCMCPCGKEVKRPGQRNGLKCHAKANREYRARVKREGERIRAIIQRIDQTA